VLENNEITTSKPAVFCGRILMTYRYDEDECKWISRISMKKTIEYNELEINFVKKMSKCETLWRKTRKKYGMKGSGRNNIEFF
jgi:hypothetical protein